MTQSEIEGRLHEQDEALRRVMAHGASLQQQLLSVTATLREIATTLQVFDRAIQQIRQDSILAHLPPGGNA